MSVDNGARVFRARDLSGSADCKASAVISEEGGWGSRLDAQVEVDVGAD
jgi:hypothetical protein